MTSNAIILPPRWYSLRPLDPQQAYLEATERFNVVPSGRRSGKTEIAKRRIVMRAMRGTNFFPARFFAGAPTRDQAKRIYWDDLKAMVPSQLYAKRPSETELCITLITGTQLWVVGMDQPQRIEGQPWDGGILDEYGNMKPEAWGQNVRPALSDRNGWCDLIGVPEGHNHYYDLAMSAKAGLPGWRFHHWRSDLVLTPEEIEAAKADLDELTYEQEYGGSFVSFEGKAYYGFDEALNTSVSMLYNPRMPLALCFDFNAAPGVAVIAQEVLLPGGLQGVGVIGEVRIPLGSTTPAVCRRIIADWGQHKGMVVCYGDATGGAGGSAKVMGSDWDLIKQTLMPCFGERLKFNVPAANPRERARVNAVNSLLCNTKGQRRLMLHPVHAKYTCKDLSGVRILKGSAGEIDKKYDLSLTHLSDALGYYIVWHWPIADRQVSTGKLVGV